MKYFLILVCLLFSLAFSCEGEEDRIVDCTAVLCEANSFLLRYQDDAGNLLIGTEFVQDSFKLSSANRILYIKPTPFTTGEILLVPFGEVEQNTPYVLELSSTEEDTLQFQFDTTVGPCCTTSRFSEFLYNGAVIQDTDLNFITLVR